MSPYIALEDKSSVLVGDFVTIYSFGGQEFSFGGEILSLYIALEDKSSVLVGDFVTIYSFGG